MPSNLNKTTPLLEKKLHEINMKFKRNNNGQGLTKRLISGLRCNMMFRRDCKLIFYAYSNNSEGIKAQLELGASPDCTDVAGRGALHIATSRGHSEVVKLLLEKGADPNRRDRLHNTPLHLAACTHNFAIISLLLKAGADVRQLDVRGKNPLQLAQSKLQLLQRSWREGSIEMIQVRSELECIVDILKQVLQQTTSDVDNLMMRLSLNAETPENVDDQMSKLLNELEGIKI